MNHFLDESPPKLLVSNIAVLDIPKRNTKKAIASRADNFQALLLTVKVFGSVWESREDHHCQAIILVATNANTGAYKFSFGTCGC